MSTVKVSVTLDAGNVAAVKALVGERGFSRYVDEAVAMRIQRASWQEFLAALDEEYGPVPDEMTQQVRAEAENWPR